MAFDVSIITLFPDAFPGMLDVSILGRAREQGIWSLETTDLRSFGLGKHRQVDDKPAGGGAGLVIRPDVAAAAIDSIDRNGRELIYLSPRGETFTQKLAHEFASGPGLICFCGRFEGLDERVISQRGMREVSLGDFVLAGGEVAAQAIIEATLRLLPGVAGNETSIEDESFSAGLLEYPQYTLPRIWEGQHTPDVLLSGDHSKVDQWRLNRSKLLTEGRRPDLWAAYLNGQRIRASETDDEHD
ncbi:tRNA (guanosine(37)-N1)-methyltransferase TrmD [Henriciella barbarensis]|uniref:tRNA (guanine-N(1)-)-methyltransferase n=2 Tax=Henriciella barbarensis TaxID=86342 RepID=A0A399QY47_9PROT|nr:tRNA (guanosine(37)-N1)-methyltransferase TrmD [Henriciella barbarensis]